MFSILALSFLVCIFRIQSKEAEELLLEADKNATEAAKAAKTMEVIMFDIPNSPRISLVKLKHLLLM